MAVFLGIDVGTSATKVLAINDQGTVLSEASSSYGARQPKPTWSEQDPEDWWLATVQSVRQCMERSGVKPGEVRAIGLTGQMHGAVFLDEADRVIRPAILWNDQRTTAECDELELVCNGRQELVRMVANRAITGFTAPKILWLRNQEPRNFEMTRKILLPKDEIRRRLTGEYATDVSDASGTLLFDVARRRWSDELLNLLDLDIALMPRCYESTEVTGHLTRQTATLLGLTEECVVVAGAGDCPAGAIGTGIVRGGVLSTSIGTSSVMMVHSDNCKVDPHGRIHTICHAVPGKWLMMGVNLSGGGCVQWFRDQLVSAPLGSSVDSFALAARFAPHVLNALQNCAAQRATLSSESLYQLLDAEAAVVPAGSDGLIFLPYLSGERTPHFDANARACFIGLTLAHTRGHLMRSIMEGVAFNMTGTLNIIRSLDVPVAEIRASGGGSRSPLWRQIQAGAFGQGVVSIHAEQGPSYGSAILAAVGAGAYSSVEEACDAMIKILHSTSGSDEEVSYYARRLPAFEKLYHMLREHFDQPQPIQCH